MPPVVLPVNRTFGRRSAVYQPACRGIGVLEIRESKGVGCKEKASRYACTELPPDDDFRTFKLTKPAGAAVYHCSIARHSKGSSEDRCDCDGGQAGGRCKHMEAIRALIGEGEIYLILVD